MGYVPGSITSDRGEIVYVRGGTTETNAKATVRLDYRPEGNARISGPYTRVWGEPIQFFVYGDSVRRPATFQWRVNGTTNGNSEITWRTVDRTFQPTFPTAGDHIVSVTVTSGTGRVTTLSRSIHIDVPPECQGGGGGGGGDPIPLRAPMNADSLNPEIQRVPFRPKATSCPPQ